MDSAHSEQERALIKKFYRVILWFSGVFGAIIIALAFSGNTLAHRHPGMFVALLIGLMAACLLFAAGGMLWASRQNHRLSALEGKEAAANDLPLGKWGVPFLEYRSKLSLFGLPLVHMRFRRRRGEPLRPVKAWFAVGDYAIGVIAAFGALTIAPISIGGCAIGLVSVGGIAVGAACWGGIGLGVWVIGGCALGWVAFGGCALGAHAAEGVFVAARDLALGNAAVADHANDAFAKAAMNQEPFFKFTRAAMNYAVLMNLIIFLPLVLLWRKAAQMKRRGGAA